jgi:Rad3-related DNA helicase
MNSHQNFKFPHTPYPQQIELMQAIYDAIESKSILLGESPTGTGTTTTILIN